MKKVLIFISMLAMLYFLACSASMEEYTSTIDTSQNLSADFSSVMTYDYYYSGYTNVNKADILYNVLDDDIDLTLMIIHAKTENYIEEYPVNIGSVNEKISVVAEASSRSFSSVYSESLAEYSAIASSAGVDLTVDDVLGFYDLKNIVETLPIRLSISKEEYIEYRIDRDLTSDEIQGLTDLQFYNNYLYNQINNYVITDKTIEEISDDLLQIGYYVDANTLSLMSQALAVLKEVKGD
jgi:hypothetical protein